MTRRLEVVDASDPWAVLHALRDRVSGEGPAVLPRDVGGAPTQESAPPAEVAQNVALVVETSGSTGSPKRVAISVDALLASATATAADLGAPGQWLLALPAYYIAGIQVLVRSITADTEPAILWPGRFDPVAFAASAAGMSLDMPRYVSLVPVQLARLVEAGDRDARVLAALRSFDALVVGGQVIGDELRKRALELGLRVVRTYGSTETCGGCVYDGRPLGQVQVRTVDGELELAGPMLAEEYLGDPQRTEHAFHIESGIRWYRTGDLGVVEGGVVHVTGRADNVIVSGGVNVSLDAVERAVRGLPGFAEAVVVGCDDNEWGEVPVVVLAGVERMPGSPARAQHSETAGPTPRGSVPSTPHAESTLARLREDVGRVLGRAARPTRIVTLTALPLLASGKPDRVAITRVAITRIAIDSIQP